jgi:hypothetical protein
MLHWAAAPETTAIMETKLLSPWEPQAPPIDGEAAVEASGQGWLTAAAEPARRDKMPDQSVQAKRVMP